MNTLRLISVLCFVLLVFSCSPKLEDAIIGKWEQTSTKYTWEFLTNGIVVLNYIKKDGLPDTDECAYYFLDKDRIKIHGRRSTYKIVFVSRDTLVLAEEDILEFTYKLKRVN